MIGALQTPAEQAEPAERTVGEDSTDDEQLAALLRALAHPVRLRIVRLAGDREWPVGALADRLGIDQPIASQHLRILRDAGAMAVRRDGNRRLYRSDAERLAAVRLFLDSVWPDALDRLQAAAEARPREARG
ncbi:MAG: metalloregulator ArsR/SmtB family transcription factor [Actinomycetota bacterium]